MLSRLSIKNYALIDELDIQPAKGLNILTGETGAGKSIILGALSLILGQRAESKYFYNQAQKCVIEGFFNIADYRLQDFFEEQDLDYEVETILRREISADGKSRAFVNDTPVTLTTLKALGERLIDIHSQHATLEINTEDFQLMTLDSVAENNTLLSQYKTSFKQYKQTNTALKELLEEVKQAQTEADYHQFLFDELAEAKLVANEQELLEQEQNQLSHAEEIKRSLLGANFALNDQEQATISLLKEAVSQLQQAERYLPNLHELTERLQSSLIEIKDIAEEIEKTEQHTLFDEERLSTVNDRLSLLFQLQQKHHVDNVSALIFIKDDLENKLLKNSSNDEQVEKLTLETAKLKKECEAFAHQLTESRKKAIQMVQQEVVKVLTEVGMPNSILQIELSSSEHLRNSGQDAIRFLFSANKGQEPQPLNKVASGGELSRLMLAIKSLIAKTSALPTIIFDEIDTGISGEVALKVGNVMESMANYMQVIAITHLPQIASKGQSHYQVYKADEQEKTRTNMRKLAQGERIVEIAQMLSGLNPGEAALQHAKELLAG
ncbi:DNA repair protein RecN [Olivibacter domesticus]|uniref:DNA repair protein RecN n=1 Tax=Olivibacter domesticus TaxID=407022 RepID=A0A1H7XTI9_OLID1|nr:DNA repair protein RecN [Olivibacter domesticus]SEM36953.1 DNA repair protein RecN (Recombination protein N) [Olivibacter domesticus]